MSWGVENLTVRSGERVALRDVTLEAANGGVTAVVGGDGAGKTTLLRCLAGALRPDSGTVRRPEVRRIGYVSSTSGTYPDLSVEENLDFAARAYGVPMAAARQRVTELLERTDLAEARDRLAGHLSGGMRQKLGVIRAMIHRPDLLVLDEPTTGVDPVSRADLWWLIARGAAEGAAVVLSSAYLDEAERASWVLALDAGAVLAEGTPDRIAEALPGVIRTAATRPDGEAGIRAWRRGASWRVWSPGEDAAPSGAQVARPDLQDAVTVAALVRELASAHPGGGIP
ncbi:MAG TPA: ABC transporter ATP-binding protein [Actinomycetota bacterium]|nr:ABC transporter ATP-binding protein [Actinomycetota bacterium]